MLFNKKIKGILLIVILLIGAQFTSSCANTGQSIDPGLWGYDRLVTYDALGGIINSREIRSTYYADNSYIFIPSGTTNMLIKPVYDGFLLAGWYTAKTDILDKDGNVLGYEFEAEDRWDFNEDRVKEDMTLYARWVLRGKIRYIDAQSGEIMFEKNITSDSPVQRLSTATERLVAKEDYTLFGYYEDQACTKPYDFEGYVHTKLILAEEEIYTILQEEFPNAIEKIVFVELDEDEVDELADMTRLYINRAGFDIVTEDEEILAQINNRKEQLIEEAIENYQINTADKDVYLKYIEGNYIRISSPSDLSTPEGYGFFGIDDSDEPVDGYIIANDIDFDGISFAITDHFNGNILGAGYTFSNITLNVTSTKRDMETQKSAGIFSELDGALIENMTFENLTINVKLRSGIGVTLGALAARSTDSTIDHVTFDGLTINTGDGDNGESDYIISDLIVSNSNTTISDVTAQNIEINASENADVRRVFEDPQPVITQTIEE